MKAKEAIRKFFYLKFDKKFFKAIGYSAAAVVLWEIYNCIIPNNPMPFIASLIMATHYELPRE